MDFGLDETQTAIKETAREFVAARFTPERVRELAESGNPYDAGLWTEMCELGWPGIAVAEEHGGQGLGTIGLVILLEELGYALAPSPLLANVCAGLLLAEAGSDEQRRRWLPGIATGERRGAAQMTDDPHPIAGAAKGAAFVVMLDGGRGRIVEAGEIELEHVPVIDTARAYFRLTAAAGEPMPGDVGPAVDRAAVVVAAELVGICRRALEMAVSYAGEREQFGRPIGAYQAVSHRCAQMLYDTEEASTLTHYAAWCADAEPESLPLAASMAKARASDAAVAVTNAALQVFGGLGFTWEHDLHFLLKRAALSAHLLGTARHHRDRVAKLSGLE